VPFRLLEQQLRGSVSPTETTWTRAAGTDLRSNSALYVRVGDHYIPPETQRVHSASLNRRLSGDELGTFFDMRLPLCANVVQICDAIDQSAHDGL